MLSRLIEKPGGSWDLHAGPRHGGYPRHRLATMTLKALVNFPRLCRSLCTLDRAFTPSAPMLWCCGTQVAGPSQRSEIGCVPPVQRSIILSVSALAPSMSLLRRCCCPLDAVATLHLSDEPLPAGSKRRRALSTKQHTGSFGRQLGATHLLQWRPSSERAAPHVDPGSQPGTRVLTSPSVALLRCAAAA